MKDDVRVWYTGLGRAVLEIEGEFFKCDDNGNEPQPILIKDKDGRKKHLTRAQTIHAARFQVPDAHQYMAFFMAIIEAGSLEEWYCDAQKAILAMKSALKDELREAWIIYQSNRND